VWAGGCQIHWRKREKDARIDREGEGEREREGEGEREREREGEREVSGRDLPSIPEAILRYGSNQTFHDGEQSKPVTPSLHKVGQFTRNLWGLDTIYSVNR
jgi:hypothetical protein